MRRQSNCVFPLILSLLVVFFAGCSSTPDAVPEEVVPATEPAVEPVVETPAEPQVDAEAAAQLAADTARLLAELSAARGEAEAAGAADLFPDEFGGVSSDYDALLKAREENPDGDFRDQIESLRDSYLALAKLSQAQKMRERIVAANLQDSDPETFQKGDQAMAAAQALHTEGKAGFQLLEQATVAHDSFSAILAANYADLCQSQREQALAAKEKADSIKAVQAAKDEYNVAAEALSKAEEAYVGKDYEVAYDGFLEATDLFTAVYDDVFVRRAMADEAIRRARQKVDAAAALAAEADEIAPLQEDETGQEEGEGNEESVPDDENSPETALPAVSETSPEGEVEVVE